MPMDAEILGPVLGKAIKDSIDALTDEDTVNRNVLFETMGRAIAEKVIDHIVNNAEVSTVVTGSTASGEGVSGTGTGTPPATGIT